MIRERFDEAGPGAAAEPVEQRAMDSPPGFPVRVGRAVEQWLHAHATLVAIVLAGLGLVLRLKAAAVTYLNPDEALNFLSADQRTLAGAIRMGMNNPHPPFYYILLWFWRFLGRSEFMLRLPSVLAGAAAAWAAFRWLARVAGKAAGLAGLIVLAFSPEVVALSAEVRSYALTILLVALSLWILERGLERGSVWDMVLLALALSLAVLNGYSAFLFVPVLALYAIVRMIVSPVARKALLAWVASQVVVCGWAVLLYFKHIARLRGSGMEQVAMQEWLGSLYFQASRDSVAGFAARQTLGFFQYLSASPEVGVVALLLFVAGVVFLLLRKVDRDGGERRRRWAAALLLVLPFVAALAAAVVRLHPFGGVRHVSFLAVFAAGGIGIAASVLARGRLWPVMVTGLLLVPVWWKVHAPAPGSPHVKPADQRRELMSAATEHFMTLVGPGSTVFLDHQTAALLRHYVCRGKDTIKYRGEFVEYRFGGYRIIRPRAYWSAGPDQFVAGFRAMAAQYGLREGEPVRVVDAGWGRNLAWLLARRYNVEYRDLHMFGGAISVFTVPVGAEPANPNVARALERLAAGVSRAPQWQQGAWLWPSDQFSDSTPVLPGREDTGVLPYVYLYSRLSGSEEALGEFLPALAFWQFGNCERHPEVMRYMDDAENYISAGFRFMLLAVDPDTLAGVYLIEPLPEP